ncbi:MAG TPA: hypothetical protein VGE21_08550 [Flavobacteriales bacterium]
MYITLRLFATSILPCVFAATSVAQVTSPATELAPYTNDSLGFSIDLPCSPRWETPTIRGSKPVLICDTTDPIVVISSERKNLPTDAELEAYMKKQVQTGDIPYEMTREEVDGHRAVKVRLLASAQELEMWVVVAGDEQLLLFSFVSRTGKTAANTPAMVASIKIK